MRRLGISGKLILTSACIVAALALAFTLQAINQLQNLFYTHVMQRTEAQVLNWIEANSTQIAQRFPEPLERLTSEFKEHQKGIAYIILFDESDHVLVQAGVPARFKREKLASAVPQLTSQIKVREDSQGIRYFELITPVRASGTGMNSGLSETLEMATQKATLGTVHVGIRDEEVYKGLNTITGRTLVSYTALVLLALAANIFLARRMAKPVAALARASSQIAAGNLTARVQAGIHLRDEVGDMVRNFNRMADRLLQHSAEMERLYAGLEEKVSERTRELEQANSRLQELDELKSQFLSTVSHELRSPLTSIKAFTEILLDSAPDPATATRFLEIVNGETDRLSRLIANLLDIARIERNAVEWHMAEVDLRRIVENAIAPLTSRAASKGDRLTMRHDEALPIVADFDRIQQVITNLVDNAIKFSPAGTSIDIYLGRRNDSGPANQLKGAYAVAAVADAGPGIPPDETGRIFEKFYQGVRNRQTRSGTGLGLAISKDIVEHHRGEIWVDSQLGSGSTFYFTVPLKEAASDESGVDNTTAHVDRGPNA